MDHYEEILKLKELKEDYMKLLTKEKKKKKQQSDLFKGIDDLIKKMEQRISSLDPKIQLFHLQAYVDNFNRIVECFDYNDYVVVSCGNEIDEDFDEDDEEEDDLGKV